MSSYIINNQTMDSIMQAINHDNMRMSSDLQSLMNRQKGNFLNEFKESLAEKFYRFNDAAVAYRYKDKLENPQDYYKIRAFDCSLAQSLRSLECLIYQCSEGQADDENIMQDMEQLRNSFIHILLESQADYKNATWGIK